MGPVTNITPLVAIVGQTASGKSALALELAEKYNGEIICADSRTIYKGMDIGTAKPSHEDQRRVPHHLLDICEPDQTFTAATFKELAQKAIREIGARGNLAFLVGGTGLYVDAVLFNFSFRSRPDPVYRKQLLQKTVEELQELISAGGLELPENAKNSRHLIRRLEAKGNPSEKTGMRDNTLVLGMPFLGREELEEHLLRRLEGMLRQGLEQEVNRLATIYGWNCPALRTIGYQEFKAYFEGASTLEETKTLIIRDSLLYAKRQKTWFKRNKHIHYIRKKEDGVDLITSLLNKNYIG